MHGAHAEGRDCSIHDGSKSIGIEEPWQLWKDDRIPARNGHERQAELLSLKGMGCWCAHTDPTMLVNEENRSSRMSQLRAQPVDQRGRYRSFRNAVLHRWEAASRRSPVALLAVLQLLAAVSSTRRALRDRH
eukprot:SAG11_NODE_13933_length_632_cov_2.073171_1_plen_132_part_00